MRFCRSLTVNISVTTAICLLLAALTKLLEAYSKVNKYATQSSFNYHYLLTKKKLLKFSKYLLLPYLVLLLWLIIFCRGCMCTSKLPGKASLSWVPKSGQVKKLLRVSTSAGSIVLFLAKTRMLSVSFSLLSSSGSLKLSSNTPHIILSEFSLKAIFV